MDNDFAYALRNKIKVCEEKYVSDFKKLESYLQFYIFLN